MSSEVVLLDKYRPRLEGWARCLACKHEWDAVVPIGSIWMVCPECSLERGRFVYYMMREECQHWKCDCGNDLFYITPDGEYCPNCGTWRVDEENFV